MRAFALSVTVTVLATAGVVSACADAAAAPPNPCTVITSADAASVLKATPASAKPKTTATGRTCTYAVKHTSLVIETRTVASASAFAASTRALRSPVFAVAGISNAYSADSGKELALWKNGTEVIVEFVGVNPVVQVQATLASEAFASL